jgi:putative hydrolase of the HAD superfamily
MSASIASPSAGLTSRAAIRNVVFDLGGVLVQWRPVEIAARFYADATLRAALVTQVFQHPDWIELDRGTLDETAAARAFAQRLGRPEAEMATARAARLASFCAV